MELNTGWNRTRTAPPQPQPELPPTRPCIAGMAHHWLIEEPSGPTSVGYCFNCDQEKVFQNSQEKFWENTASNHPPIEHLLGFPRRSRRPASE